MIGASGGEAMVYGHSSGAVLALVGAAQGLPIAKVVAYEPPLFISSDGVPDFAGRLHALADAGQVGDAAELFLTVAAGVPAEVMPMLRASPDWAGMEAVADTLWHDATISASETEDDMSTFEKIGVPVVLVDGGLSAAWANHATTVLAAAIPDATQVTVEGADHRVPEDVVAPLLIEHLG